MMDSVQVRSVLEHAARDAQQVCPVPVKSPVVHVRPAQLFVVTTYWVAVQVPPPVEHRAGASQQLVEASPKSPVPQVVPMQRLALFLREPPVQVPVPVVQLALGVQQVLDVAKSASLQGTPTQDAVVDLIDSVGHVLVEAAHV